MMKALNEIRFPRLSTVERSNDERMYDESNQRRLNDNFRQIARAISEHDDSLVAVPALITAAVVTPEDYVKDVYELGSWTCRKWKSGRVECFGKTASLALSVTAASGGLYYAETAITIPAGLFTSVSAAFITSIYGSPLAFASIKALSVSTVNAYVVNSTSALINVVLSVMVAGRWKEE